MDPIQNIRNNNQLVSIITPCYNSARYISQAIESVLAQTYQYWEMLIIDDCSTDGTVSIIKNYIKNDTRIKLLKTENNSGGPVKPRNIGIKNAQGRFIAFLDSDDKWLPSKLEKQINGFDNDEVAVVFSYYEKISGDNSLKKNRVITSPKSVTYAELLRGNCIGCLTAIYDTEKVGKCYFQLVGHEDYAFWLSVLRLGYVAHNTNTVEALYRTRSNSISKNKLKAAKWTWDIYRRTLRITFAQSIFYFSFYFFKAIQKYLV